MDPYILLSLINTKLRDQFASLKELCEDLAIDENDLLVKLSQIGYTYDKDSNQFKFN